MGGPQARDVGDGGAGLRRSAVVGLPAVGQSDGRMAGRVADLLFSSRADRVIGLLLTGGTWWRRRLIPYEEVAAIGPAAVMLRSPVVLSGHSTGVRRLRRRYAPLLGMRVLTADGRDVGVVDDLYFDPRDGRISGYVVSGGLWEDLRRGPGLLPVERVRRQPDGTVLVESRDGGPWLLTPL